MRTHRIAFLAVAALAILPALQAADDEKPQVVELKSFTFKVPMEKATLFGHNTDDDKLFFYTNGSAEAKVKVAKEGEYEIVVKASSDLAQKEGAKFKLAVEGKQVGKETLTTEEAKEYTFKASLKAADQTIALEFTNDVYKDGEYDRNLFVHAVSIKKAK